MNPSTAVEFYVFNLFVQTLFPSDNTNAMKQKEGCLFEIMEKIQMGNLLVLTKHRPERQAVFELRTEFAAAKDFKTTLLCIFSKSPTVGGCGLGGLRSSSPSQG